MSEILSSPVGTLLRSTLSPVPALRPGPGALVSRLQAALGAAALGVEEASSRQIDDAVAAEEGRPDGDVLPPDAVDRLLALVGQLLLDGQHGGARLQGQGLLEEEGRPVGADRAAEADSVRGVLGDDGVPGHGVDLGVGAEVGAPIAAVAAAAGKDRLPPSLVDVHPHELRRRGGTHEPGGVSHPHRRAPHEVDVGGLVDELADVGALVDQDDDAEQLVLQDGGLQPAVAPGVGDAAAVAPLHLVVHPESLPGDHGAVRPYRLDPLGAGVGDGLEGRLYALPRLDPEGRAVGDGGLDALVVVAGEGLQADVVGPDPTRGSRTRRRTASTTGIGRRPGGRAPQARPAYAGW